MRRRKRRRKTARAAGAVMLMQAACKEEQVTETKEGRLLPTFAVIQEAPEQRKERGGMTNQREQAVTAAEVFCVKCVMQELKAERVPEGGAYWREVSGRTEKLLLYHREEIRDMYRNARQQLRRWILEESGAKDAVEFQKMQEMGLTGDIASDIKLIAAYQREGEQKGENISSM